MPRICFLGDIVGRPGRDVVANRLSSVRETHKIDLVVANGENAAAGAGLTGKIARSLHSAGVDAITLGDHCWDQRGFESEIGDLDFVCRPANLPLQCPGLTSLIVRRGGFRLGVITVLGQQFMKINANDPFACVTEWIEETRRECDAMLVEIHAEATSEKVAMGWYLDGQVAAVIGTHTHVPTADVRVLPRGTAYQTDAGMTGPYESVLGRAVQPVVARFLDGMPRKLDVADGDVRMCGLIIDVDASSGLAKSAERLELGGNRTRSKSRDSGLQD